MYTSNLQTLEGWSLKQCSMDLLVNMHVKKGWKLQVEI